jgi:2Fe-2S ferredoxin
MDELLKADLPVASSCDGEGVCGKCRIKILSGADQLSPRNETEVFLMEQNNYSSEFRIACQTQIHGDIEVDATYW